MKIMIFSWNPVILMKIATFARKSLTCHVATPECACSHRPSDILKGAETGKQFPFANVTQECKNEMKMLRSEIYPLRRICFHNEYYVFRIPLKTLLNSSDSHRIYCRNRENQTFEQFHIFWWKVLILWKFLLFTQKLWFLMKCRYFVKMDSKSTNKPLPTEAFERVWRKNHKFHDILHNYPKMIFCAKNLEIHGNPSFHLKSALFRHPLSNASVANGLLILFQTIFAKFPFQCKITAFS